ncbi:MAG: CinA family protein [Erysipelotrichaceae bacterium]|nr:CinA family protein [Erysipelotrichaceae bacterium]MDP3306341.1 CinA family protein [Erysipelotrichaceae bacterium]
MEPLIDLLRRRQWKLASCESITGGDFASQLTDISGASDVYLGGYIVYSNEAKRLLTYVDDDILKEFGAVSRETVEQMAKSTKKALHCDIAIAFSGNAGPNVSSNQPVGRVFTAIAVLDHCFVYQDDFVGSRKEIKAMTVEIGIRRILDLIKKENMR